MPRNPYSDVEIVADSGDVFTDRAQVLEMPADDRK